MPLLNSFYVPYDSSYLDRLSGIVRGAIGSSTNVSLLAFASVMGILALIAVVRFFTHVK